MHVIESVPDLQQEKQMLPRASHKVLNLKDDLHGVQKSLEEILSAVILL